MNKDISYIAIYELNRKIVEREKTVQKVLMSFGISEKALDDCTRMEIANGKWKRTGDEK